MKRSRSELAKAILLRPAPYLLTATIVGTVALVQYHPETGSSSFDPVADTAHLNADGSSSKPNPTIYTNAQMRASMRGSVPYVSGKARTVRGAFTKIAETHPFGRIQVEAVVESGRITDVRVVKLETYDGRSKQIADFSVPSLLQTTLVSGAAAYDHISSATYTSRAYAASLQSAIDQLRPVADAEASKLAADTAPQPTTSATASATS
jgi:uncharacterized protein with FMN-binding domain